jgi:hypothetical protein
MIKTWRIGVLATAVLTIALLVTMPLSGAAQVGPGCSIEMSRMIPMRDGVELRRSRTLPLCGRVHFLVLSWSNKCYLAFQSAVLVAIRAA